MKIILNFVFSSSKSVILLVILMRFLPSNGSHFPSDLLFLSIISFGSSKSIIVLVILMLFSKFSWKYSFFIWFVTIFFFIGISKENKNYIPVAQLPKKSDRQLEIRFQSSFLSHFWTFLSQLPWENEKCWIFDSSTSRKRKL